MSARRLFAITGSTEGKYFEYFMNKYRLLIALCHLFRWHPDAGGISSPSSQSFWTQSSLWCANVMIRSPLCTLFTMVWCQLPFGGVWSLLPVAIVPFLVFLTHSCIFSCTHIICWPPWDPRCKSIFGGRSIWPSSRWCSLFWWCYTLSSCSLSMSVITRYTLPISLELMLFYSTSYFPIFTSKRTNQRFVNYKLNIFQTNWILIS